LGALTLERELNWLEGKRAYGSGSYVLRIDRSGEDHEAACHEAEPIVAQIEARLPELPRAVAAELVEPFNDTWRQEDEAVETAESLAARIALESVHIDELGGVTVSYGDGDLFGGHTIQVHIADDGSIDASLAG